MRGTSYVHILLVKTIIIYKHAQLAKSTLTRVHRELEEMFNIKELPTVVVLRPNCSVLTPNAVDEIIRLGPACYRNWQEAAELIDRNFMITEDFQEKSICSFTDPVRRLKYKVEDEKKRNKKRMPDVVGDHANVDGQGGWSPW